MINKKYILDQCDYSKILCVDVSQQDQCGNSKVFIGNGIFRYVDDSVYFDTVEELIEARNKQMDKNIRMSENHIIECERIKKITNYTIIRWDPNNG